uniref:RING-type E3 ubiquitin transferase n=1 Tax=Plectus sambesii TaxID=2011161 RepID=A0A914VYM3_9BILA
MSEETNSNASDQRQRRSESTEVPDRHRSPTRTVKKQKKKTSPPKQDDEQPLPPLSDDVEDFQCPICFQILIKPITLCCNGKHTLCTPCFEGIVEQGSMECPLCKLSIHRSWLRKHKVTGLLNAPMWDHIQRLFPDDVRKRAIQDEQGPSSSADTSTSTNRRRYTHQIAKPGEIGEEFRAQAAKLEKELHTKERLQQMRLVELADDVLAHKIQYLSDSVAVDDVLHEEWDAVMESVQKKMVDNATTNLTPDDAFTEFYGTELKEKKNKEGPILYPPEDYEKSDHRLPSTQQPEEVDEPDIFAELDLDSDVNWQPIMKQVDDLMSQSSEYSVELGGAALLAPRLTHDNPDSLLFPNPAFAAPNFSRGSFNDVTLPSHSIVVTREQPDYSHFLSSRGNVAMSPVVHKSPAAPSSFLDSEMSSSTDETVSPAATIAETPKKPIEETQRIEKCAKTCPQRKTADTPSGSGKISKEAVRTMLLGSPKRQMGGRLLFKAKKRLPAPLVDQRPPMNAASPVGVVRAEMTSSIIQPCRPPSAQKNSRKRAIALVETPLKSINDLPETPPKSPPSNDQPVSNSTGVGAKKSRKRSYPKKESKSRPIPPQSTSDTSVRPPRPKRRSIERPTTGDPQDVLDKKMAEALQWQFDDEMKSNGGSFRVRRELGTDQYYNFRRKSRAKSFTSAL